MSQEQKQMILIKKIE